MDFSLDGRCGGKQEVFGAAAHLQHEVEQVVRAPPSLPQPAPPAGLVGLVEDDRAVLRSSRYLRSPSRGRSSPVETMAMRNGQRAMSSGPRVLTMWPLGSSQIFFVEDQTALGMPSLSAISTCHCRSGRRAEDKHRTVVQRSARTSHWPRVTSVLPTPTSSASSSRALPVGLAVLEEHRHE